MDKEKWREMSCLNPSKLIFNKKLHTYSVRISFVYSTLIATVEYFTMRHLEHAGKLFGTSVLVYKPLRCLLLY